MKCGECNFKEVIGDTGVLKCLLTEEEHEVDSECSCERIRTRRENEARLLAEKEDAAVALAKLRDRIAKPIPDVEHIYDMLKEIKEEVDSVKLEELIQYIEEFI
jgi:hypothetical protein